MSFREEWPLDGAVEHLIATTDPAIAAVQTTATNTFNKANDIYNRIGAPAGADIAADIAENQTDLDAILAELANATYGLSALHDELDNVDADHTLIKGATFNTSTDSLEAIRDALDSARTEIDGIRVDTENIEVLIGSPSYTDLSGGQDEIISQIQALQNDTSFSAYAPEVMERPIDEATPQTREYLILVDHKDQNGNMENFDSAPTVDLESVSGTDRSAYLYNGAGTQTQTMDNDATGQYSLRVRVAYDTVIENLMITITGIEATKTRVKRIPTRIDENFTESWSAQDRATLNDTNTRVQSAQTDLSEIKGTGFDTATDSLKAIADQQDLMDSQLDDIEADTQDLQTQVGLLQGGTFSSATDSNEAIRDAIDALAASSGLVFEASKASGTIASGNSETVVLDAAAGMKAIYGQGWNLDVIAQTQTSSDFDVEVFEDVSLTKKYYAATGIRATSPNPISGLSRPLYGRVFMNQDGVPIEKLYVKITNNTDPSGSIFDVSFRGKKMSLAT